MPSLSRRAVLTGSLALAAVPVSRRADAVRRLEKWRCTNQDCEPYVYDPSQGAENIAGPDHPIPPGVAFEDLPDDWVCPVCGDVKAAFLPGGEWVTVPDGT